MTTLTKMVDGIVLPCTDEDYAQLEKDRAEQATPAAAPTKEELMAELAALTTKIQALE